MLKAITSEDFADWLETSIPLMKLERWSQPFGMYKNAQVPVLTPRSLRAPQTKDYEQGVHI